MKAPAAGALRVVSWVAPAAAAAAFAFLLLAFHVSIRSYRQSVLDDARRELEMRAALAARNLAEPLRTQDFAALRAFGERCRARGHELAVRSPGGGLLFDTRPRGETSRRLESEAFAGEHRVVLSRPFDEVLAPLRRAYRLFVLAASAGATGVLVFFVAYYRQRVRIRELARLEEFRRAFVADVSHEIKTPLTGILGAVEMLSAGTSGEAAQKRLLGMIARESQRLNALVQQILDLARLERETGALDLAATDLAVLADETLESFRLRAEADGVRLRFSPPGTRCVATVDARLVAQALGNLIENALRHACTPDIAVAVVRAGSRVEISVEDHGIGIPPAHATRVFERFYRVDPARTADSGGAGLGLAIVKGIARLHGGDVSLASASPHGCRFILSLPV